MPPNGHMCRGIGGRGVDEGNILVVDGAEVFDLKTGTQIWVLHHRRSNGRTIAANEEDTRSYEAAARTYQIVICRSGIVGQIDSDDFASSINAVVNEVYSVLQRQARRCRRQAIIAVTAGRTGGYPGRAAGMYCQNYR